MSKNKYPPTFIVGCGRSGTTLLRAMLNSHSKVAVPPESLFIIDYLRAVNAVPINTIRSLIIGEEELHDWGIEVNTQDLNSAKSVREIISGLHEIYLDEIEKQYWIQKTPRFVRYWDLLKKVFPEAKFIVMVRDPRAVANSLKKSEVHRSNAYFGAKRWEKDVGLGLQLKDKHPEDVLEIRYEDLVENTQDVLKKVCNFLKIDYQDSMLNYYESKRIKFGEYHKKIHKNISGPIKKDRVNAWKNELNEMEIRTIESITKEKADKYGYGFKGTFEVNEFLKIKYLINRFFGIYLQVVQYLKNRRRHLFYSLYRKCRLGLLKKDIVHINY